VHFVAGEAGPAIIETLSLTNRHRELVYRPLQFQKRRQLFIRKHASARPLQDQTHRELMYRPFQFHKRSKHFIGMHDETLSVAMSVSNPDCSPFTVQG